MGVPLLKQVLVELIVPAGMLRVLSPSQGPTPSALAIWHPQMLKSTMLPSPWPRDPSGYITIPPQLQPALVQVLLSTTIKSKNACIVYYMKNRIQESISVLSYPKEFNGIKLSFLQEDVSTEDYNNNERIPSWFWLGPTFDKLPINKIYRKRLCSALLDFNH